MAKIDQAPLNTEIVVANGIINFKQDRVWSKWLNQIVAVVNGLMGSTGYVITNVTPTRTFNVGVSTTLQLANLVGTLIQDLQNKGILS